MSESLTFTFNDEDDRDVELVFLGALAFNLREEHPAIAQHLSDLAHRMVKQMNLKTCPFCSQEIHEGELQ